MYVFVKAYCRYTDLMRISSEYTSPCYLSLERDPALPVIFHLTLDPFFMEIVSFFLPFVTFLFWTYLIIVLSDRNYKIITLITPRSYDLTVSDPTRVSVNL